MSLIHELYASDDAKRLDHYLSEQFDDYTRSAIQRFIKNNCVCVNNKSVKNPNTKVKSGDYIVITPPPPEPTTLTPTPMDLDIIYEDDQLLVINKSVGLVVHPGAGHWENTLVHGLLHHCGDSLSGIGGVSRPGIVHRLDKDTSGLMVVAKTDTAHTHLSEQLQNRTMGRIYTALVWGRLTSSQGAFTESIGRCPRHRQKMAVRNLGGKDAHTNYEFLGLLYEGRISHVKCQLETGRTHQIRVHFNHHKHPLVGDPIYGYKRPTGLKNLDAFPRQALHASELYFTHPLTGKEHHFTAPLPDDMKTLMDQSKTNV
jgi:23S rRNA pseudouridine1911/1915/1917 synthase